jgi:putative ABC transport system substrate-binding protein
MTAVPTRCALLIIGIMVLLLPSVVAAEPRRVVVVSGDTLKTPGLIAFDDELRRLGYVEGRDVVLELVNSLDKSPAALTETVAAQVRRGASVIVAHGTEGRLKAAMDATHDVPIVMVAVDYDPLAKGYVDSLARPRGNVTGVFHRQIELTSKRLDLLRQTVPGITRLLILWDEISVDQAKAAQMTATALGLPVRAIELRNPPYDYERALAEVGETPGDVLMVMTSPIFFGDRDRLGAFALHHRLPSIFGFREWADAGGLMSYGAIRDSMIRLAAHYVDKILKGAKPADLPVEQPTKFELVVNLKTANALALIVPQSIVARADEVIE